MSVKADNLTIRMNKGTARFIVQEEDTFYLVDLYTRDATRAYPPNSADIFLRSSYFEDTDELTPAKLQKIQEAFKDKRENPVKAEYERHGNNGNKPRL